MHNVVYTNVYIRLFRNVYVQKRCTYICIYTYTVPPKYILLKPINNKE